jgi:hypothetical protein
MAPKLPLPLVFVSICPIVAVMSSKETVIDFVRKLPEDMPLAEIARKVELLAGIQNAREQARRHEGLPPDEARKRVRSWASK